MICDRAPRGFFRVRFGVDHGGETAGHGAPMIKNPRNVADLRGRQPFDATQSQVVILRALEPFAKAADLAQKFRAINAEMIDVVLPEKKFRVPIRFEKRVRTRAVGLQLVLVRINQAHLRVLLDLQRHKSQRLLRE